MEVNVKRKRQITSNSYVGETPEGESKRLLTSDNYGDVRSRNVLTLFLLKKTS